MAEVTAIQWTHHTFNPWRGCTKVSPGCANCYAEALSARNPSVLGEWGPGGKRVIAAESYWREPLRWNKAAAKADERRRVFCASLADVFEDRPELVAPRLRLFGIIRDTEHLDWLLLTKRPENIARMWPRYIVHDSAVETRHQRWTSNLELGIAAPNIWLGVSVEDQQRADERIPHLLSIPAAVRFLSCEPLLGPLNLTRWIRRAICEGCGHWMGEAGSHPDSCKSNTILSSRVIDWLIVGGESGPGSRLCKTEWIRSLVWQCRHGGTACFVKQLGANYADEANGVCGKSTVWPTDVLPGGPARRLADPKGGDMNEFPEDLRIREFPA